MIEAVSCAIPLAIQGGKPVRTKLMPSRLALGQAELKKIEEVIAWYRDQGLDPGYQGHFEEIYCQKIAHSMGGGYVDAVATGTVSLYVALAALDLPKESEVLVSPITDPGTLSAIILLGLKPKLLDAKPESFNIGCEQVEERLDDKTSCALVVHVAGQAVEMEPIVKLCHERGVKVLEDCSQAHGATINGSPVGTFGDIAAFSTMYRKASISGSTGGFIYTKSKDYYHQALAHADRGKPSWQEGFDDRDPSQLLFPALNLHANEIGCGIGIASWERLPATIKSRHVFITALANRLREESKVCRPYAITPGDSPFYFPIFVDESKITCSKTEFAQALIKEGIGLNPHYRYLVQDWPWLKPYLVDDFHCANAKNTIDQVFCLYLNEHYGEEELEDIMMAIIKVENYYRNKDDST